MSGMRRCIFVLSILNKEFNNIMKTQQVKRWLGLVIGTMAAMQVMAMNAWQNGSTSLFDQWQQEDILKIQLEVNLDELLSDKYNQDYMPARVTFKDNNRQELSYTAEVKIRGRFRRKVCDFPPLKIKLSKKELIAQGYTGYNDFKLVTHCLEADDMADETLIKEYLAYEMYNLLSDYSFRAQLVKVTYKDTDSNKKMTRWGILLEDADELAARVQGMICEECFGLENSRFNQENVLTHAMYQYMIGNTDWSLQMNRNLKLIRLENTNEYVVAPYDFDFSGFVSAPYAVPNSDYALTSLRQRYFMGTIDNQEVLQKVINKFQAKKKDIYNLIDHTKGLQWETRQDLMGYIDSFYNMLKSNDFKNIATANLAPDQTANQ